MARCVRLAAIAALLATGATADPAAPAYPRGRIVGHVFADYFYNLAGDPRHAYNAAGADTANPANIDGVRPIGRDLNGFQIRRVFLQLDHDLSPRTATRLRLEADGRSLTSDGKPGFALKIAHLEVKRAVPRGDLLVGLLDTPTWDLSERIWRYRSIEKTIADFRGIGNRAELGAELRGALDPGSRLGYALMVANGAGQRSEDNRYKKVMLALPVRSGPWRLEPYADYEGASSAKDRATYKLLAAFETDRGALGIEALDRVNHRPSGGNQEPRGLSIFARAAARPDLWGYARVDFWQPDRRARDRVDSQLWIAGIDWQPLPTLHVMPNVETTRFLARGAAVAPPHHDLQARITLHYGFSGPASP